MPTPTVFSAPPLPRRLLTTTYLVAGMPLGTCGELVPLVLRAGGVSLGGIGLFSLLYLPYSFKLVWGPLVDRLGHPARWLLACGAALAFAYLALAHAQPAPNDVTAFACAALLLTSASSVYDVAVDASFVRALAESSPPVEARANAWRLSSFKLAMVACSNGCAVLAGAFGFPRVFYGLLGVHLVLLAAIPWRALPVAAPQSLPWRGYVTSLWAWAKGAHIPRAFALVLTYKLTIASIAGLERPFWFDRGVALTSLGAVGAATGLISTVLGAWAGSALAHRYGAPAMLRWGVGVQFATAVLYLGLTQLPCSLGTLAVGLTTTGACFGLSTAALMSLITRLCAAPHAATQFAALTGTYALTRALGGATAGLVADRFGYPTFFLLAAALTLPAFVLLPRSAAVQAAWRLQKQAQR